MRDNGRDQARRLAGLGIGAHDIHQCRRAIRRRQRFRQAFQLALLDRRLPHLAAPAVDIGQNSADLSLEEADRDVSFGARAARCRKALENHGARRRCLDPLGRHVPFRRIRRGLLRREAGMRIGSGGRAAERGRLDAIAGEMNRL